ncbi:unnamed protein product [Macrosiphum euphorbiae]|uniref:Uncharacterized protein n=1 Tax=Macrosiphum euphorbiae TaxID=13131 RepID=A0AAV0XZ51_9HEMI|nr:unnamed protein product [Macrosiphum euphorbiae]
MDMTSQPLAQLCQETSAAGASSGPQPDPKRQKTQEEAARSALEKHVAEIEETIKIAIISMNEETARLARCTRTANDSGNKEAIRHLYVETSLKMRAFFFKKQWELS